jgi:hypothetical protein
MQGGRETSNCQLARAGKLSVSWLGITPDCPALQAALNLLLDRLTGTIKRAHIENG